MKGILVLLFVSCSFLGVAQNSFQTTLHELDDEAIYGFQRVNAYETDRYYVVSVTEYESANARENIGRLHLYKKNGELKRIVDLPYKSGYQIGHSMYAKYNSGYVSIFNSINLDHDSTSDIGLNYFDEHFNLKEQIIVKGVDGFLGDNIWLNEENELVFSCNRIVDGFGINDTYLAKLNLSNGKLIKKTKIQTSIFGGIISFNYFPQDSSFLVYSYQYAVKINNQLKIAVDSIPFFRLRGAAKRITKQNKSILYNRVGEQQFGAEAIAIYNYDSIGNITQFGDSSHFGFALGRPDTNDYSWFYNLDFLYEKAIYCAFASPYKLTFSLPFDKKDCNVGLSRFESNGRVKWTKYYGDSAFYFPVKTLATEDGGALIISSKYDWRNYSNEKNSIWILKIDSSGNYNSFDPNAVSVEEALNTNNNLKVYPNPVTQFLNIEFTNEEAREVTLTNTSGQIVIKENLSNGHNKIDVSGLHTGIYFYQITGKDQNIIQSGKVVKN